MIIAVLGRGLMTGSVFMLVYYADIMQNWYPIRRFCAVLWALLGAAFVVMASVSFSRSTTFGFDMDKAEGPITYYTYYRLRWPGDGSFRLVGGAFRFVRGTKPLEPFDLGGRFFKPPTREMPQSVWNQLGFWWKNDTWADDRTRMDKTAPVPWQWWVGVPSLLPAALLLLPLLFYIRSRKRAAHHAV